MKLVVLEGDMQSLALTSRPSTLTPTDTVNPSCHIYSCLSLPLWIAYQVFYVLYLSYHSFVLFFFFRMPTLVDMNRPHRALATNQFALAPMVLKPPFHPHGWPILYCTGSSLTCRALTDRPNLFGLVIGIDEYKDSPLKGAVADARAMKEFLESNPAQTFSKIRIDALFNKEARRQKIMDVLRSLMKDDNIRHGDAIVIFFAGHGGRADVPPGWHAPESKGEFLIPYDCGHEHESRKALPILDRTLGLLIKAIAAKKGNNIVRWPLECEALGC